MNFNKNNLDEFKTQLYETGDKGKFVHLHLHSDFSLKDGLGKPTQYAKMAIELKMPAIAITDHGSIGSHPSFFMFCRSANIKPIVGIEAYLNNRRLELDEFEKKSDELKQKLKSLKSILKHKKISRKYATVNLDVIKQALNKLDLTVDDIEGMDIGEVKEKLTEYSNKTKQEYDSHESERDQLKSNQHIVLLAKNETGRKNITKIVSDAAINGFYYKPRTSFDFIKENKEGVIVSSACMSGIISHHLRHDDPEEGYKNAFEVAKQYKEAFGDDFYIEIMLFDMVGQIDLNKKLIDIAKKLNIKLTVTNDVHYPVPKGAKAQEISLMLGSKDDGGHQVTMKDKRRLAAMKEVLDAIGDDKTKENVRRVYNRFMELDRFVEFKPNDNRDKMSITVDELIDIIEGKTKFKRIWSFSTTELYFKDRHQMIDMYFENAHYEYFEPEDFVQALDNTVELANSVNLWDWDTKEKLPKIEFDGNQSNYDKMVEMVREGFVRKATDDWYDNDSVHAKRVKYELSVIRKLDLTDYFLIVADYIKYAKQHNILVGAGRGSASGSLVCYLLDITNLDPIPFNLLFERFLSMSRSIAIYDLQIADYKIEENCQPVDFKPNAKLRQWFENDRIIKLDE